MEYHECECSTTLQSSKKSSNDPVNCYLDIAQGQKMLIQATKINPLFLSLLILLVSLF